MPQDNVIKDKHDGSHASLDCCSLSDSVKGPFSKQSSEVTEAPVKCLRQQLTSVSPARSLLGGWVYPECPSLPLPHPNMYQGVREKDPMDPPPSDSNNLAADSVHWDSYSS